MTNNLESFHLKGEFYLGEWLIKPATNELVNEHESRRLDQKVMRLLLFFTDHAGKELSKEELIQGVWGEGVHNEEVLTVVVSTLRKGLGDDPKNPRFIKTIPRFGYILLNSQDTPLQFRSKNIWQFLEQRVGLRFLIISSLIGLFLLIILVQVLVEIVYFLTR